MENTPVHHVKKVFDENNIDLAEKKLDQKMEKIMAKGWVEKFLNIKIIKDLLSSHAMNDINEKVAPYLKTVFIIIGWISIIAGIVGIFSFLVSLSGLGFVFSFGFGIGLRVVIYIILALAFALLSLLSGIGMIKFKKWVLTVVLAGFVISLASFVISLIPSGFYASTSYGRLGSSFFNLLLTFVFLLLVFKNKDMFKN